MQKFMDKLLEQNKDYAKCYINDIVIFSDEFRIAIKYLDAVLQTLAEVGMTLLPNKCYVRFHSLVLLGHKVDQYGLSTLQQKVTNLEFPTTLSLIISSDSLATNYFTLLHAMRLLLTLCKNGKHKY